MDRPRCFVQLIVVSVLSILNISVFSTSAFSDPVFGVESCSKIVGTISKNCYEDDAANGWDDASNGSLDGWVSSNIQEWHGNETVPYRFDISLPAASDASTYFVRVEQDNLQSGVTGIDSAKSFYVGAGANASVTEGQMTKHCTAIPGGSSLPALPYQGNDCVVAGPTFTGVDDDGDGRVDEEIVNGIDDDGDGLIDEDPMPDCASSIGEQHIQYTAAIHFDPDEAGSSTSNWAIYWLSHLAVGSNYFPGGTLDTWLQAHRQGDGNTGNECHTPIHITPGPEDYCDGVVATIVGTDLDDTIFGTSGNDVIFALKGNDTVQGKAGNDTLCGGDGDDILWGQDGDDIQDGGPGNDTLYGHAGNDQLFGGDGTDTLYGFDGDDYEDGGAGNDYLYGDAGNDTLFGGDGNDVVYGQDGDDIEHGGPGDDTVNGFAGRDQLYGDAGVDHLNGGADDDIIDGGAGNDFVIGSYGNDQLIGGADNDYLNGQEGDDSLDGSDGTDTCIGGGGTDTATNCESISQVP